MGLDVGKAFGYIDKFEQSLDDIKGWLDNTFSSISLYGQEGVDAVCAWTGDWASYKVAQVEEKIVKGLHGAFMGATGGLGVAAPIYNLATGGVSANPAELATGLLKIAFPWVPPTIDAIQTLVQVPLKLVSITSKIASLATYRPPIETPGINFSSFNLNIKPPSMGDVMTGQFELPDVPKPFTEYMKECIAQTKENIRKAKEEQIAQMNEEDRKRLEEKQQKAKQRKEKAKMKTASINTKNTKLKNSKDKNAPNIS